MCEDLARWGGCTRGDESDNVDLRWLCIIKLGDTPMT